MIEEHRRFVRDRFGVSARSFAPLGEGWASYTYLADDQWVFQFRRRAGAEETLRKQIVVLRNLSGRVGAMVPTPIHASLDPVCMGYRKIEGVPFTEVPPDRPWPDRFGRFLRELHAVPP